MTLAAVAASHAAPGRSRLACGGSGRRPGPCGPGGVARPLACGGRPGADPGRGQRGAGQRPPCARAESRLPRAATTPPTFSVSPAIGRDDPRRFEQTRRRRFLGDIVIATGVARRQARAAGHSERTEVRMLALHGLLHLSATITSGTTGAMARARTPAPTEGWAARRPHRTGAVDRRVTVRHRTMIPLLHLPARAAPASISARSRRRSAR